MAAGNPIRGSRVGAGRMGEADRGELAPRRRLEFFCANGHTTRVSFAAEAEVPDHWDCPTCGLPGGRDAATPPPAPRNEPYKTHLAYVKERRTDEDGEALLAEALAKLAERRGR
ncbi:RNA polymerase-binding protein RbpA [Nakamurella sp. YIM 132087]|uniref:RNA polymerase-binding protein RbpA n=1 Tax=Nakamurella alba TaxID=2665158 RepID=A0A7K1FIQ9_9ACTN|nr:RNA polymerase-binding protein RbpA [Nakamurella alba]MTD13960.1 RNA polymerase-binding protein RbpA [Nakamurella alba]